MFHQRVGTGLLNLLGVAVRATERRAVQAADDRVLHRLFRFRDGIDVRFGIYFLKPVSSDNC